MRELLPDRVGRAGRELRLSQRRREVQDGRPTMLAKNGELPCRDGELQTWSDPSSAQVLARWALNDGRLVNSTPFWF